MFTVEYWFRGDDGVLYLGFHTTDTAHNMVKYLRFMGKHIHKITELKEV